MRSTDENQISEIIRPKEFLPTVPVFIKRPCDYGLELAIAALETQLGTFEAYNRLCLACEKLHVQIDSGNAKAQNVMFRTDAGFPKENGAKKA